MDLAYGATHIAFGRAGATFLAEIDAKRIPAILVPYPFGNGHQRANAEVFARSHKAVVIEQSDLTPEKFLAALEQMQNHLSSDKTRPAGPAPARQLLADYILQHAKGAR
jgi:UDP-N-acetylglucosamine--N-acetylmuramyl-(pentapeptide) pyrophosphoryl-undecaprenol N-acetylglucosamine transferase